MAKLKSPHEMFQAMKANIEERTGNDLDHWVRLAEKSGIMKFKALTDHMKAKHGLTHGYAQLVAWAVIDPARLQADNHDESMVDDLYTGAKAALRPIYDRLIADGRSMGDDVDLVICKTYSSLRSKSQYAMVVPRTKSAVDLELAMPPGTEAAGRLEKTRNSNPKITHRIRINDVSEIDAEVIGALKRALEQNRG